MDALSLLHSDHLKVSKLLEEVAATTDRAVKKREELFEKITTELKQHEEIEEKIFYPALKKENPEARDIVLEAGEEHHLIDGIIDELQAIPFDNEIWKAKFTVLKENIEHHVKEEEQVMFKKAKQVFNRQDLEQLAKEMQQIKDA
jgi:iron-sulfur cluster repair protein YtfE (RIC family)